MVEAGKLNAPVSQSSVQRVLVMGYRSSPYSVGRPTPLPPLPLAFFLPRMQVGCWSCCRKTDRVSAQEPPYGRVGNVKGPHWLGTA